MHKFKTLALKKEGPVVFQINAPNVGGHATGELCHVAHCLAMTNAQLVEGAQDIGLHGAIIKWDAKHCLFVQYH